jgi:hypothetical protein
MKPTAQGESDLLAYVQAAAALMRLPLDEGQAKRVAAQLERTAHLAALLESAALDVAVEPAEVYCPAPFPSEAAPR